MDKLQTVADTRGQLLNRFLHRLYSSEEPEFYSCENIIPFPQKIYKLPQYPHAGLSHSPFSPPTRPERRDLAGTPRTPAKGCRPLHSRFHREWESPEHPCREEARVGCEPGSARLTSNPGFFPAWGEKSLYLR